MPGMWTGDGGSMIKPLCKMLYLTDTHFRGSNPRSRVDNFSEALFTKLEWVVGEAIRRKVDVVVHGGDWFDNFEVASSIVARVLRILYPLVEAGIPIISTVGSHDLHGYSLDSLGRTSVNLLSASGFVNLLVGGAAVAINDVCFYGLHHRLGSDDPGRFVVSLSDDLHSLYRVMIVHDTIVEREVPGEHWLVQDVRVNADLVLSGHYHGGYRVYSRSDGVVFCNPGALARLDNTRVNRVRRPAVAYIEIWPEVSGKRPPTSVEVLPVPVAQAGELVFADEEPVVDDIQVDISKLVSYLRQETDNAMFMDISELLMLIQVDGDEVMVREARVLIVQLIQEFQLANNE